MKRAFFFTMIITFLFLPASSYAWGKLGHRVIGGIAELYINAKAKAAIKKLLGNESIAMASNWADFIKSDRSYDYLGPWHYINVDSGKTYTQFMQHLQSDSGTDLYTKLNLVIRELKSGKLQQDKQLMYLRLLIHLVGDVHQPMHVARPDDKGGNDLRLSWFSRPSNLHRVWDEDLVEFQQLSYTEHIAAINFASAGQREKWTRQPIREWFYESYQEAQKLYKEVKENDKLWYDYNYYHVDLMNKQLLKGGVRLAGLLNEIYGK